MEMETCLYPDKCLADHLEKISSPCPMQMTLGSNLNRLFDLGCQTPSFSNFARSHCFIAFQYDVCIVSEVFVIFVVDKCSCY